MIPVTVRLVLTAAALLATASGVAGQNQPVTLRSVITQSGFSIPPEMPAKDLDRALTSSDWAHDANQFVAGVYFVDELEREQLLGPLQVIRITKGGKVDRRVFARNDENIGGSVLEVSFSALYTLVRMHVNPSAGSILVLDSAFSTVTTLEGFASQVLADGTIIFSGNQIHFAPFHRASLWSFAPKSQSVAEIFPGENSSRFDTQVRQGVQATLARLGEEKRAELEQMMADAGVDLTIRGVRSHPNGQAVAFNAVYGADRLSYNDPNRTSDGRGRRRIDESWPVYGFSAIVVCARSPSGKWTCREEEESAVTRRHKVTLPDDYPARGEALETLLDRVLREPFNP